MNTAKQIIRSLVLSTLCLLYITTCEAKTIRVATLNAYNYLISDRWIEGKYRKEYPKPESEKSIVREVISTSHPDIIILQEIGGPIFLEELQRDLRHEGIDYPYSGAYKAQDSDRCLAYLSKEKPSKVFLHHSMYFEYGEHTVNVKRGLLQIDFNGTQTPWSLFCLHLKSPSRHKNKLNSNNTSIQPLPSDPKFQKWRTSEATVIANTVKDWDSVQLHPSATTEGPKSSNFIILGDFNDGPKSPTLKKFNGVAQRVNAVDSTGHNWTYMLHTKEKDKPLIIDHILLSPALFEKCSKEGEPKAHIENVKRGKTLGSDHRMLYIDIDV